MMGICWTIKDIATLLLSVLAAFLITWFIYNAPRWPINLSGIQSICILILVKIGIAAIMGKSIGDGIFGILEILGNKYDKKTKRRCIPWFMSIAISFALLSGYFSF